MASLKQISDTLKDGGKVIGKILVGQDKLPVKNKNGKPTKSLTAAQITGLSTDETVVVIPGYDGIHTYRLKSEKDSERQDSSQQSQVLDLVIGSKTTGSENRYQTATT